MKDFSIAMALADYIPVLFFGIAAVILQKDLYHKMRRGAFALFAAGTLNVFFAGALKATYKLLYAAGICDFQALNNMFFPTQSLGFLLAGIGMIAMFCGKKKKAILLFVISFVCSLCMGYLSSQDFTQVFMNWMAEIINVIGQGTFLVGVWMLHKAGLAQNEMK